MVTHRSSAGACRFDHCSSAASLRDSESPASRTSWVSARCRPYSSSRSDPRASACQRLVRGSSVMRSRSQVSSRRAPMLKYSAITASGSRPVEAPASLDQHPQLGVYGDLVVKRLDLTPEGAHFEDLARGRVCARQQRGRGPGLLPQAERERGAGTVDELVGDDGRDDLPPQTVVAHLRAVALGKWLGEVALEVVREVVILRHVGVQELGVQEDLALRHQDGELRLEKAFL